MNTLREAIAESRSRGGALVEFASAGDSAFRAAHAIDGSAVIHSCGGMVEGRTHQNELLWRVLPVPAEAAPGSGLRIKTSGMSDNESGRAHTYIAAKIREIERALGVEISGSIVARAKAPGSGG